MVKAAHEGTCIVCQKHVQRPFRQVGLRDKFDNEFTIVVHCDDCSSISKIMEKLPECSYSGHSSEIYATIDTLNEPERFV